MKRVSRNVLRGKYGAIVAIFLCIGVAIVPSLSCRTANISLEKDTVEVTVTSYGVPGGRPHTVNLTKSQYVTLTSYLDDLGSRLDATGSQGDAARLFHEAFDALNTYGLLPKEMSVLKAHRLVSGRYDPSKTIVQRENTLVEKWCAKFQISTMPEVKNKFCVLYASATKIPGYSPNPVIIPIGMLLALGLYPALIASLFGNEELEDRLIELGLSLWMSNPLRFANYIVFKGYTVEFRSLGLKGLVSQTLNASGAFIGFTGLMFSSSSDTTHFLGFTYYIYGPR